MDALKAPLFEEKVVDFVLEQVQTSEKKLTAEELYAYNPEAPKTTKKAKKNKIKD